MKRVFTMLTLGLTLSCSTEVVPTLPGRRPFSGVTLSPEALNVGVNESRQFTAVARDAEGTPLSDLPGLTYSFSSSDTTVLKINAAGLATGIKRGTATVTARAQSEGLTYPARTVVTVSSAPIVLGSFVVSPDVATVAAGQYEQPAVLVGNATDQNGASITVCNYYFGVRDGCIQPAFRIIDPTKAFFNYPNALSGLARGQTQVIATVTSGGVTKVDTATITVTNASATYVYNFDGYTGFSPATVIIKPGGTVTWYNASGNNSPALAVSYDVTFDNPGAVTGGNISAFKEGAYSRTFPTAGTYKYRSTTNGAIGTVLVE